MSNLKVSTKQGYNGITMGSLIFLALIPVLAIFCTGVMAAPAVRKVFEGEQNIFR